MPLTLFAFFSIFAAATVFYLSFGRAPRGPPRNLMRAPETRDPIRSIPTSRPCRSRPITIRQSSPSLIQPKEMPPTQIHLSHWGWCIASLAPLFTDVLAPPRRRWRARMLFARRQPDIRRQAAHRGFNGVELCNLPDRRLGDR